MAVQLERPLAGGRQQVGRQLPDGVGREQAARILEVHPIHLGAVGERGRALGVIGVGVHGADRVGQPDDDLLDPLLASHRGQPPDARRVVGGIGDLQPADAVARDEPEGEAHHVLAGRHPGDEAHPGRDHPQRRVGHGRAHPADALPRVLLVKADRDRHVGARGEVERVVADLVEHRRDRQHVRGRQAGGALQALVAVARRRVDELDRAGHRVGALSSQLVVTRAAAEVRVAEDVDQQRAVGLHALDVGVGKGVE